MVSSFPILILEKAKLQVNWSRCWMTQRIYNIRHSSLSSPITFLSHYLLIFHIQEDYKNPKTFVFN